MFSMIFDYPWYFDLITIFYLWFLQASIAFIVYRQFNFLGLRVSVSFLVFLPLIILGWTSFAQVLALTILYSLLFIRDIKWSEVKVVKNEVA